MNNFLQDVRFALRILTKAPGFAVVAVLTLALGIGATTTMFSMVKTVLLDPLPYQDGQRLAIAVRTLRGSLQTIASYPDFTDWQQSGVFEKSAAVVGRGFYVDTPDGPVLLSGRRVSEEFFDLLGVRPAMGRGFLPGEAANNPGIAVISHQLWTRHLESDPQIVGKELRLRGQNFQIAGVLPQDFADPVSPLGSRDIFIPLVVSPEERVARNSQWVQVVGRLARGVTLAQAAAQVQTISERGQKELQGRDPRSLAPFTLMSLREHQVGNSAPALWMLLGAVGFVLLIGSANVSNLLLARITSRRHELAVRAALGAGPRRLAAQLMTESLLLSAAGGALGLLFVLWTVDLVKVISPVSIPRLNEARVDPGVFAFALVVTAATAVLFGLLPVLRGARQDVNTALKQAAGTGGVAHARSRGALLIAEVALTVVLLVGAALSISSLNRLLRVDPGFATGDILTATMVYAGEWPKGQQWPFYDQIMERTRTLPGVRAVGVVDNLPFSGAWSQFTMDVDFFAPDAMAEMKGKTIDMQQGVVGGDYFRVMSIPLRSGRLFDQRDTAPGAKSLIVSESLARALWGDADPVGRTAWKDLTVVGVVGDVRHFGPDTPLVRTVYRPMAQREAWGGTLVVLTDREPALLAPALREAVRQVNSAVLVQRAGTMGELVQARTAAPRFLAVLLGSFGGAALLLAAIGIYGVIAYSVSQRTREIGVRIALGAQPGSVLGMIIRGGLRLAGAGVAIGLAGAVGLSGVLRAQLFEVSALDPWVYAAAAVIVAGVTLLACYVPARRAARVDPMVALRDH